MIWRDTLFFLCFLQKKTECFGTITQFTKPEQDDKIRPFHPQKEPEGGMKV